MMKKIFILIAAVVISSLVFTSCTDKKAPADSEQAEKANIFTREDTTKVFDMVNQFTTRLQNNDIEGAVDMLIYFTGDSIKQLDQNFRARQSHSLMFVAGKPGYELDRVVLNSEVDNEAKIDIELFEKKEGDTRPNTTSFYLRPIRIDGQWYLTTRDNITENY